MDKRTYDDVHRRTQKLRGRAATRPCVDCGIFPAKDWSHIHNTDPMNHYNYEPRCRRCHIQYDMTEEWRTNIAASLRGKPRDSDTKEKLSLAAKQQWADGKKIEPCQQGCTCGKHSRTIRTQKELAKLLTSLGIDVGSIDLSTSSGIEEARRLLA